MTDELELLPADVPALTGRIVGGKYRVGKYIGAGGMGTVWQGVHIQLGSRVAIKFIRESHAGHAESRRRFEIEAQAAARLTTKHSVRVFDYGVTEDADSLPYIVMEFLEGESLSERVIRLGPLPPVEVAHIVGEAARALSRAHAVGIVHRDLKPDNIFLSSNEVEEDSPYPYLVKLVDFGIAKMFEGPVEGGAAGSAMGGPTREGAVIGTPNFMSPEQLTEGGAPNALTDLWALGACAFAAVTARIPFEGDVLGDIVLKVCVAPLPLPSQFSPNLPPAFDDWFMKACAREPHVRFQTAAELATALERACGVSPRGGFEDDEKVQYALKPASPEAIAELLELERGQRSWSPRTALLAGLVLGLTILVGVLGFLAVRGAQGPELPAPRGGVQGR